MSEYLAIDSLSVSLAIAFVFGLMSRMIGMPPMLGFLFAGFALAYAGIEAPPGLEQIADFGVLLMLFTIGLKLKPKLLMEPQVYGGALGHMAVITAAMWVGLLVLGIAGVALFAGLTATEAAVVAFALSFSSTVFAVKVFEEKGELGSVHGKTALGILIIQDLAAVAFLVASTGDLPSPWAVVLIGFVVLPWFFGKLLDRLGHGEMIPLFGLFAVLVLGAASFKAVGLKADLGALVMGMLMAKHKRSSEVADALLSIKDIFLIGFFLNIGLQGLPSLEVVISALVLLVFLVFKVALFFALLVAFRLRARTALLSAIGLGTFSEFGLIVGAVAVDQALMSADWLLTLALALALSFVVAAPLNDKGHQLYARYSRALRRWEATRAELSDPSARIGQAEIMIFGMGRLGSSVYRGLAKRYGDRVVGVETDLEKVAKLSEAGWHVVHGDATDSDFWRRAGRPSAKLRAVLLAMPDHDANMYALQQIRRAEFDGFVAAMVRFSHERKPLIEAGANLAYDVYDEAGTGFAGHVAERLAGHDTELARRGEGIA
ncbi:MAG: cation:proton antiporter [Paracoccaceae bacterium]